MKYAPSTTLFDTTVARAVVLGDGDVATLQQFFERNPDYFWSVNGEAPCANEAHDEMNASLPDGWPHTWQGTIGFIDAHDELIAMANVVTDLLATGVFLSACSSSQRHFMDPALHRHCTTRSSAGPLQMARAGFGSVWSAATRGRSASG